MKKPLFAGLALGVGLWVGLFSPSSFPQSPGPSADRMTATEVIARCAEAMGGRSRVDGVRSLRVGAVYPDHGDRSLFIEIRRPNMSYSPQAFLVFDGRQACLLRGMDMKSKPEMVDPGDLVDFDVEVGYFFPAFFDFPAEYLGADSVDGRVLHKVRPKLPHGAELVYYLDSGTWLPYKTTVRMTVRGQSLAVERVFSDYRTVAGIPYPHGFTYPSRDRKSVIQGRVTSVEINPALDDAHFTIPKINK